MIILDFMAMLSDPGGFSKAAEKQAENMKAMGIEQTEQKPVKKEEGPKWSRLPIIFNLIFSTCILLIISKY